MIVPFFAFLLLAVAFDLKRQMIPDWLTLVMIGTGMGTHWSISTILLAAAWSMICAIVLFVGSHFLGYNMGGGDLKLAAGIGAWLGPFGMLAIFLSLGFLSFSYDEEFAMPLLFSSLISVVVMKVMIR